MNKKGFTLIELLVVIAIIGILSSVVLASLSSARTKGADAAIKSSVSGFMSQAEILYNSGGSLDATNPYGVALAANGTCPATAGTNNIFDNATALNIVKNAASNANATGPADTSKVACFLDVATDAYSFAVKLRSVAKWQCIDSTGNVTTSTTVPAGTTCAASN